MCMYVFVCAHHACGSEVMGHLKLELEAAVTAECEFSELLGTKLGSSGRAASAGTCQLISPGLFYDFELHAFMLIAEVYGHFP